jgi:hypothetical protein
MTMLIADVCKPVGSMNGTFACTIKPTNMLIENRIELTARFLSLLVGVNMRGKS